MITVVRVAVVTCGVGGTAYHGDHGAAGGALIEGKLALGDLADHHNLPSINDGWDWIPGGGGGWVRVGAVRVIM
jgi:hypothetical protein